MAEYKFGLDIGNSGFKMVGKIGKVEKYDNIKALVTSDATDNSYVVQLEGEERPLYFGIGEPLATQDKTKNPYLKHILLLSLATMYGEVTDCEFVKVGVGLPLKTYKTEHICNSYKETLNNITEVAGYVNGKYYFFKISLSLFAEGYSAFYYLMPNLDKRYRWLIADHGYRSTDVVGVSYDSSKERWKIDNYKGVDKGLLEMYTAIAKQYSHEMKAEEFLPQDIEYYMRENTLLMTDNEEKPEVNMNDFSYGAIAPIAAIYNEIHLVITDLNMRKILLLGGGAELVHKHLERNNKVLEEKLAMRLYGNAMGFYLQLK